jgi:hypothetical protein
MQHRFQLTMAEDDSNSKDLVGRVVGGVTESAAESVASGISAIEQGKTSRELSKCHCSQEKPHTLSSAESCIVNARGITAIGVGDVVLSPLSQK